MLGVGPYCYTKAKLVWLTAGESTFAPQVFSEFMGRPWQANQALQAFIPLHDEAAGERIGQDLTRYFQGSEPGILGRPRTLSGA